MNEIKIVVTGSILWQGKTKIREILFKIKNKFPDVQIISGGMENGADKMVKNICMEFGMGYFEIPPFHQQWNNFCIDPPFKFGKQYSMRNFFVRNTKLANVGDHIILFVPDKEMNNNIILDLIKKVKKLDKKLLIIK